jgi:LPPG:FO 2-phospho-L-lactate transferase
VRTRVMADDRWWPFQEFMIKLDDGVRVQDVDLRGLRAAPPTPEVLQAIATARAIVIGPSNPVISIGPILGLSGLRAALRDSPAPVVAVSPLVHGTVVKGPTHAFMQWSRQPLSSAGIAACYADVIDGLVADEPTDSLPVLEADMLMDTAEARRRVADQTLRFALSLP